MSTLNIGWLFYKDYLRIYGEPATLFREVQEMDEENRKNRFQEHFEIKNEMILSKPFETSTSAQLQIVSANPKMEFKTLYPGLTLGTGYTHETGEMGEFKLGFFFDYSTGYPCIPGSTVKGSLRSIFPQKENDNVADKEDKYNYLASVIREISDLKGKEITLDHELGKEFDLKEHPKRIEFIDLLEREIFDGEKPIKNEDGSYKIEKSKIVCQSQCIYDRDIFHDGFIVSSDHPAINRSTYQNPKPFLGDDYITPHVNRKKPEMSPFTNPIPLMFLKILPEVNIQFQFDLKAGLLTREQKEELFRRLLLDFGIGAKTNVGYGQFEETKTKTILHSETESETNTETLPDDIVPSQALPFLIRRSFFPGVMIRQIGLHNLYKFKAGKVECTLKKGADKNPNLKIGDNVTITFNADYQESNPNFKVS